MTSSGSGSGSNDSGTAAPDAAPTPPRGSLVLLSAAQFMVVLDFTIVNVALPSIQSELGMTTSSVQWVISAYSIAFGGFLLLGGRLADYYGRRRMFELGLVLFSLGSLAGALAPDAAVLVGSRAVQGLGAAVLAPAGLSLLVVEYPSGPARARAIGVYASLVTVGFAAGAVLGGVLVELGSWRWVFAVNVLIGALALAGARMILPADSSSAPGRLDLAGAVLVTLGMAAVVFAAVEAGEGRLLRAGLVLLLSVVLFAAFVLVERRVTTPLVPLTLFRNRSLVGANTATLIAGAFTAGELLVVTLYLQQARGWTALATGLAFLPQAATAFALSRVAASLIARAGIRLVLAVALAVAGLALALMGLAAGAGWVVVMLVAAAVMGMANRFSMVATTLAGTQVDDADEGLASALLSATRQSGSAFGVAVLVAVVSVAGGSASFGAARAALLTAAGLAVAGAVIALLTVPGRTTSTPSSQPVAVPGPSH